MLKVHKPLESKPYPPLLNSFVEKPLESISFRLFLKNTPAPGINAIFYTLKGTQAPCVKINSSTLESKSFDPHLKAHKPLGINAIYSTLKGTQAPGINSISSTLEGIGTQAPGIKVISSTLEGTQARVSAVLEPMAFVLGTGSIFNTVALTIDRCVAVTYPLRANVLCSAFRFESSCWSSSFSAFWSTCRSPGDEVVERSEFVFWSNFSI